MVSRKRGRPARAKVEDSEDTSNAMDGVNEAGGSEEVAQEEQEYKGADADAPDDSEQEERDASSGEEASDSGEDGSGDEGAASGSGEDASGSEEEASGSDGEDKSDSEVSEDRGSSDGGTPVRKKRKKKKKKAFVLPPPREMPTRTTRANRYGGEMPTEDGDEDFWNQEFFAEEEADSVYSTESEPEDRFDRDFDESEEEEDDGTEAEKTANARDSRKKSIKPPGAARAGASRTGGRGASRANGRGPMARPPRPPARPSRPETPLERRKVRDSTRRRIDDAEEERKIVEAAKPKRTLKQAVHKPLTQTNLLAEAARTEIENTKSLELMLAFEEETKRRNTATARRVTGPVIRWRSRRVGDAESTTVEVRNMPVPPELRRSVEPSHPAKAVCAVTGLPARYRDPLTGLPYANVAAFSELRRGALAQNVL